MVAAAFSITEVLIAAVSGAIIAVVVMLVGRFFDQRSRR